MKCVSCARDTNIGEAYALPFLVRAREAIQNLYACSRECRDEWHAARRQVLQFQSNLDAPRVAFDIRTHQLSLEEK